VSFSIARLDGPAGGDAAAVSSEELVEHAAGAPEVVLALDGAMLDEATAEAIAEAAAVPESNG
jgi:hypothetical protein